MELKNALNKFLQAEVQPYTHLLEKKPNKNELSLLYSKLKNFGLFNPKLPMTELVGILTQVAKHDASLALTILANHHAQSLISTCSDANVIIENIVTTDIYSTFPNSSAADRSIHYISGFTNTLVEPYWKNGSLELQTLNLENDLTIKKTIGAITSPLLNINTTNFTNMYKSSLNIDQYNELILEYRIAACAIAIGLMKGSYKTAKVYASERSQGGRLIKDWSQVQMQLANINLSLITSNAMLNQACSLLTTPSISGKSDALKAISIKIINELNPLVDQSISILGGFGYMKEFPQEKRFRDAKHVSFLFNGNNKYLLELGS